MSALRRCSFVALVTSAVLAGGLPPLPATASPAPAPAPAPRVTVSFPTAPDGRPVELPTKINDRGEVVGVLVDTPTSVATVVWQRGRVTPLGPAGLPVLAPRDISERGQVVGMKLLAFDQAVPFSWHRGQLVDLPIERPAGVASDVSERGWALGVQSEAPGASGTPVAWTPGGELVTPPALPEGQRFDGNVAGTRRINDRGQAALDVVVDGVRRAAVWQVGGGITLLPTLGGQGSTAVAINQRGDVVGASSTPGSPGHAFLWRARDRRPIDLGALGTGTSQPTALNDRGEVVGTSVNAAGRRVPFLWRNGTMTELATLGSTTSSPSATPHDINNRGQVVGDANLPGGPVHATLWQDGRLVDLGALADPAVASSALDINDRGEILGWLITTAFGRSVLWTARP